MIKNFANILTQTIKYCFYDRIWLSSLALWTFVLLFVNHLVFSLVPGDTVMGIVFSGSIQGLTVSKSIAQVLGFALSIILCFPLTVSIMRQVVLNKPFYSSIWLPLYAKRQQRYLWVLLKVYAIAAVPWILFWQGSIFAGSFMDEEILGTLWSTGLGLVSLFSIYILTRLELANVLAALDQPGELSRSWAITKGNVFLILSVFIVLILLLLILSGLLIPFSVVLSLFMPITLGWLYDSFFMAVISLLFTVPIAAASGFVYVTLLRSLCIMG